MLDGFEKVTMTPPPAAAPVKMSVRVGKRRTVLAVSIHRDWLAQNGVKPRPASLYLNAAERKVMLHLADDGEISASTLSRCTVWRASGIDWLPDFSQKSEPVKAEVTGKDRAFIVIDLPDWFVSDEKLGAQLAAESDDFGAEADEAEAAG